MYKLKKRKVRCKLYLIQGHFKSMTRFQTIINYLYLDLNTHHEDTISMSLETLALYF